MEVSVNVPALVRLYFTMFFKFLHKLFVLLLLIELLVLLMRLQLLLLVLNYFVVALVDGLVGSLRGHFA